MPAATIHYTNGARLQILSRKVLLRDDIVHEQADGTSPRIANAIPDHRLAEVYQRAAELGGTATTAGWRFAPEQLPAVAALAADLWGAIDHIEGTPEAVAEVRAILGMTGEAPAEEDAGAGVEPIAEAEHAAGDGERITGEPGAEPELVKRTTDDPLPWRGDEPKNWFSIHYKTPDGGRVYGWVRRTAHAHAIGRLALADVRRYYPDTDRLEVYDNDRDPLPVAVVTDPAPVCARWQEAERLAEDARRAKWAADRATSALLLALQSAHAEEDHADGTYHTANACARLVDGIVSRPTVLKALHTTESGADD